jgi:hypothetical protein
MTMIERAARRLCALEAAFPTDVESQRGPAQTWIDANWRRYVGYVREVLVEALDSGRELSDSAVQYASAINEGKDITAYDAECAFKAMIDAALEEE